MSCTGDCCRRHPGACRHNAATSPPSQLREPAAPVSTWPGPLELCSTERLETTQRWEARRHSHPACACDRNVTCAQGGCVQPTARDQPTDSNFSALLHLLLAYGHRRIVFVGDSVALQHECDFRCRLAHHFVGARPVGDQPGGGHRTEYEFRPSAAAASDTLSVSYLRAGAQFPNGIKQCTLPQKRGPAAAAMAAADLVLFSIGNHFRGDAIAYGCLRGLSRSQTPEARGTFRSQGRSAHYAMLCCAVLC